MHSCSSQSWLSLLGRLRYMIQSGHQQGPAVLRCIQHMLEGWVLLRLVIEGKNFPFNLEKEENCQLLLPFRKSSNRHSTSSWEEKEKKAQIHPERKASHFFHSISQINVYSITYSKHLLHTSEKKTYPCWKCICLQPYPFGMSFWSCQSIALLVMFFLSVTTPHIPEAICILFWLHSFL